MSKVIRKHDQLSRKFLSNPVIAREFLKTHLSPELLDKCILDSLQIEPTSFIEDDLKTHYSDILYRLDLKDGKGCAYIYTLIEHQSVPRKLMPFRMLKYQVAALQQHLDKNKGCTELPIVVGLIFYNGSESPYPYELDISNLFSDVEAYKQAPLGTFKLVDLTVTEDTELLQHGKLALLEVVLKHINAREFKAAISSIIAALRIWQESELDEGLLSGTFQYLMKGRETEDFIQLVKQINQEIPELKENIMTYAEELEQRGIQKGKQEGIQLGKQEGRQEGFHLGEEKGKQEAQLDIARNLLKSGVAEQIVAEATKLPLAKIRTLN